MWWNLIKWSCFHFHNNAGNTCIQTLIKKYPLMIFQSSFFKKMSLPAQCTGLCWLPIMMLVSRFPLLPSCTWWLVSDCIPFLLMQCVLSILDAVLSTCLSNLWCKLFLYLLWWIPLMCLMNEVCVLDLTFVHPQLTQDNLVIP